MVSFKFLGVAAIYALSLTTQVASALPTEDNTLEARGCLEGSQLKCQQAKAAACNSQCAAGRPRQALTCLHTCFGNAASSCAKECA